MITYSCVISSGPTTAALDFCNKFDDTILALFTATGSYTMTTADMVTYPAGDYTFEIIGTIGTNSDSETFVATFVDPCPTTPLTITLPDPFTDKTHYLRGPVQTMGWDINSMIT